MTVRRGRARLNYVALPALAILLLLAASPSTASAEAGPVGSVFPAEGTSAPAMWTGDCPDETGGAVRIGLACEGDCGESLDLFVERVDAAGTPIGARVRVNEQPATNSAWMGCSADGRFAVVWQDYAARCYFIRSFDASMQPVSRPFHHAAPDACESYEWPSVILFPDASLLAAWSHRAADDHDDLLVRRFAADGTPFAPPVRLGDGAPGWSGWGYAAWNETGTTLVVWAFSDGRDFDQVFARVLDPIGRSLSPSFPVSETPKPIHIGGAWTVYEGDGVFTVYWYDWDAGGTVGRRVSFDVASAPATTTTTLPPADPDVPSFGEARVLDSEEVYFGRALRGEIQEGADAAWYVRADEHIYPTYDDARRWQDPFVIAGGYRPPITTDGNGLWLGLHEHYFHDDEIMGLDVVRSADDGATWSDRAFLAAWHGISNDCDNCWIPRARVVADALGSAVAVWTFSDWEYTDYEQSAAIATSQIFAASTHDAGLTWSDAERIADHAGYGGNAFDLATDGQGTWVVLWADASAVRTMRSTDGGRTWSAPSIVFEGLKNETELAAGDDGEWLAVFEAAGNEGGRYGHDTDVFVIRSLDGGVTWQTPAPIAVYAVADASRDVEPSIATDGNGRWMVAWSSHHPLGGTVGLDADIFVSMSADVGSTWSTPVAVNRGAGGDATREHVPRIAADERGVWMLTWRSRAVGESSSEVREGLYVALAGDACADGTLDVGEECDDGNALDGDGCDRNCTLTSCGNSIITDGEECDDGNQHEDDACLSSCARATCGDGRVQTGVEQCDDGNRANVDACLNDCSPARCGDGFVQRGVEQCDDGNDDDSDDCPASCRPAVCGDGYVRAGSEECDDGNPHDDDGCVAGCSTARCGDGFVRFGVEQCDPAHPAQQSFCTSDCGIEAEDACGDVDGDGLVLATDARTILLVVVGSLPECPRGTCDLDANRRVTVTDARLALFRAVGLAGSLACPQAGYVVFVLSDTRRHGALGLEIDYAAAGGAFAGVQDDVDCTTLIQGVLAAYNHDLSRRLFSLGLISAAGFDGPRDLARCRYFPDPDVAPAPFVLTILDASAPDLTPIAPPPVVTYRFE